MGATIVFNQVCRWLKFTNHRPTENSYTVSQKENGPKVTIS